MENEKQLTEEMLLDALRNMGNSFFPVEIREIESEKQVKESDQRIDMLVEIRNEGTPFRFAVDAKSRFNPKIVKEAAQQIKKYAEQLQVNPLVLTPYLSEEQLRYLESEQVSGIDLCGNGIITVPGQMLIYRTGNPNKYPSSNPIRNVYRGTSSLVVRAFLLRPEYETSQELLDEITARGGEVTLPTVSKVCSVLEDDLIIERKRKGRTTGLRLLQAEKLLNYLVDNYEAPVIRKQLVGKCELDEKVFEEIAQDWSQDTKESVVRTGASSSDRYATMAREPIRCYYSTDVTGILKRLGDSVRETDRFPNFQILQTEDPTVYFDIRDDIYASPLQSFLELNAGDKREHETAEQIRQRLLQDVNASRWKQ